MIEDIYNILFIVLLWKIQFFYTLSAQIKKYIESIILFSILSEPLTKKRNPISFYSKKLCLKTYSILLLPSEDIL